MKILMLGDYSNLHACLAKELRRRGHEVTVVSDGGAYMKTEADVMMRRGGGLSGALAYLWHVMAAIPSWKGYDVVQLINPGFLNLRSPKLKVIFDILKKNNRRIYLTLCGNDYYFVKDCVEGRLFRFSEFRVGQKKTDLVSANPEIENGWFLDEQKNYVSHLYSQLDGAMSVLPEYDMSGRLHLQPEKIRFTNIPVDLADLPYTPLEMDGPLKVLVGMKSEMALQKGTSRLLHICREIASECPGRIEVDVASGLSLTDYIERIKSSHVVIDQLYSYSPATNALQTMALGRVAATGWQPECAEMTGCGSLPVIPLAPDVDVKSRLKELLLDRETLRKISEAGRRLVERENDVRVVAERFETHWQHVDS